MGYVKYVSNPRKPSLAQLVERGTVVEKTAGIPGSPVQFRNGGLIMFFFNRKICPTIQFNQNRDGDRTQRVVRFAV